MRTLVQRYRKQRRKANHINFLQETVLELSNGIIRDVISINFQGNKESEAYNIKLQNKAKLLTKYNRRYKLLVY
jgi:hypothetical protein